MASAAMTLCMMFSAAACADNGDDTTHLPTLYDVVEFTSQNSEGTVFTLWRPDATVPVSLSTGTPAINTALVAPGESLFLAYTPLDGKAYASSGRVEVVNYGTVNNAPLMAGPAEKIEGWDTEPVYLMSLWRAGDKVCMRLRMTYDSAPRVFALVMDEATAGEPYPTAYLYHRRPSEMPNFSRQYYAAFNLASLWDTPGCRGVNIRVCNSNIPSLDSFVIENPRPVDAPAD